MELFEYIGANSQRIKYNARNNTGEACTIYFSINMSHFATFSQTFLIQFTTGKPISLLLKCSWHKAYFMFHKKHVLQ